MTASLALDANIKLIGTSSVCLESLYWSMSGWAKKSSFANLLGHKQSLGNAPVKGHQHSRLDETGKKPCFGETLKNC